MIVIDIDMPYCCAYCICGEADDELDYVACRLAGPEDHITMLWIPYDEASKQRHEACPLRELTRRAKPCTLF